MTLLLLSPIIVDGLPGTTRLSTLVGLISEIATYGGATLLIRWLGRSRGLSNGALILLGIAYALLEECVFLQTSLTPSFGAPAGLAYGRVWGVRCSGQWATNPSGLYSCPLNWLTRSFPHVTVSPGSGCVASSSPARFSSAEPFTPGTFGVMWS